MRSLIRSGGREDHNRSNNAMILPILAIIIIGGLEALAMYKGVDGKGLALTIAAIAGLAGYKLKDIFPQKK